MGQLKTLLLHTEQPGSLSTVASTTGGPRCLRWNIRSDRRHRLAQFHLVSITRHTGHRGGQHALVTSNSSGMARTHGTTSHTNAPNTDWAPRFFSKRLEKKGVGDKRVIFHNFQLLLRQSRDPKSTTIPNVIPADTPHKFWRALLK